MVVPNKASTKILAATENESEGLCFLLYKSIQELVFSVFTAWKYEEMQESIAYLSSTQANGPTKTMAITCRGKRRTQLD